MALELPHARPMDFTGRVMRGFIVVAEEGLRSRQQLQGWLDKGVRFVRSLPPGFRVPVSDAGGPG